MSSCAEHRASIAANSLPSRSPAIPQFSHSAIDDDDSEWEDSIENKKTFFRRVDFKSKPISRRSLITMMVDNRGGVGNVASRSISALPSRTSHPAPPTLAVSPNDSDDAPLMMKRDNGWSPLKPITEVPRSAPWPISESAILSPRTTRRNMLATEWPNSLRKNVLWERGQKLATANAIAPQYFSNHTADPDGYHSKGW